ncbi:DNA-directed RNA polymerase subunit P [Vulcanisaeta distributa]|uniref:DNA-directed RNA polymerase subunit Rpo12 n=1 Tax=Vulcanisaeta distributa (strain DSM 14429 / JCM 11212 / NBRC 100878 / IC-017) TaxID=572478 RepID=E1QP64_VULDI|nr:DNA-directed RNA polymerase subunit P [Vulcanisaeta distributa]ADN50235.1 RNA polymerase Rbp10 [Vulcanisaeta distributa DSM 14429]
MGEAASRKIYMCLRCGRVFSLEDMITPGVHCPYCGYRIIVKIRSFQTKRISHIE